ncbi:MAG: DNA-deoxyinosine glycosylase [Eubacterium sp.]|nr:DNA-deoxyinosine glycosylase [Eubacterium sp.]
MIQHNIPPVYDENSKILILGSFPSVKSREGMFFYHHPQNRFWKVLSAVLGCDCPQTVEEKKVFLLTNNIALWDVVQSCTVTGSSDSSIKDAVPNPLRMILDNSRVMRIYTNGNTAYMLYNGLCREDIGIDAIKLPSTSPANAAFSLERLIGIWREKIYF